MQKLLQFEYLETLDPLWFSLAPLLAFNLLILASLAYFTLTYSEQPTTNDVDNKVHSRLLSRFFKEYWYWFISPAEKICLKLGVSPNVLTVMGFILSCFAGFFFHLGRN